MPLDASKTKKLTPGDTGTITAKAHHFAIARGATQVTVSAIGAECAREIF